MIASLAQNVIDLQTQDCCVVIALIGKGAIALQHLRRNFCRFTYYPEFSQYVVANERPHFLPSPLLRHGVEFRLQITNTNGIEYALVSRCRSIKSYALLRGFFY